MAGNKKYLAIGLALALAIPTSVYAEETIEEKETYIVYSQDIIDKSENKVGRIEFTSEVDPESFAKEFDLTATVYKLGADETKTPVETVDYEWVDPFAEEDKEENDTEEDDASKQATYKIVGSGTYSVHIGVESLGWNLDKNVVTCTFDIKNIDITAPVILGETITPSDWTNGKVEVTVECVDNQPAIDSEDVAEESEKGSGLHSMAYSFDGGTTWSNTNKTVVDTNKTLSFVVRDALGNQTTKEIKITNIDKTAPTVSLSATNEKNADGKFVLTATASDAESGLAEYAYSWNGGQNWYSGPEATISVEGTFSVVVRDKAGNTATASTTIVEKVPETETEDDSDTDSGNTGNNAGSNSGSTGSNSGTGSGSTGNNSGTGSGSTDNDSSANNGTIGNPDWEDDNHVSGVVDTDRDTFETEENETSETETDETSETETDETKESKETKETKEKETKDKVVAPAADDGDGFTFPVGLALIIAAILIVLSIIILVIKMMYDHHVAAIADDDEEEEDMSKVYARVNKEEAKVVGAAAAAKAAKEAEEKAKEAEEAISDIPFEDMEVEEAIGAAVTAAIATEEPVVKKVHRKHEPVSVPEAEVPVEPAAGAEEEISIGEFAAAAVAAGVAVVDGEKEMEAAISEMEEEKAAIQASAANPTESVVIEGAHSRLIIDPETGEYTYEFK